MDFEEVRVEEGNLLADLRAIAMKPSLEALGRFNEHTVRSRFLDAFVPADSIKLTINGKLAGFFVLRNRTDHLYLDHLYIHPEFQNRKLGQAVIQYVRKEAAQRQLPIRLGALRGSPANPFYLKNNFIKIGESDFDIYYEHPIPTLFQKPDE
ncbi:GNAT family N-acetyltransferase [Rouxiella sp. T17]|uniref:GNAT family N-acetyltransferase n=1 Tax=Rouxiella sp. T17 TaxID=3085684 RepID=UPI002FCA735A